MSFYAASIGQMLIVHFFALFIWFFVMVKAVQDKPATATVDKRKVLVTSIGLVVHVMAILAITGVRAIEEYRGIELTAALLSAYTALNIGGFIILMAASIGNSFRLLRLFVVATVAWNAYYFYAIFIQGA